jgi:hypothetical protein
MGFRSSRNAGARTCVRRRQASAKVLLQLLTHQRTFGVLKLFKKYQGQAMSMLWRSRITKQKVIV